MKITDFYVFIHQNERMADFMRTIITVIIAAALLTSCSGMEKRNAEEAINVVYEQGGEQSLSEKSMGWGFVKKKGEEPDISQEERDMMEKYDAYYIDPAREKRIYLTFDEGYENGYTAKILDVLQEKDVKAAFFVTGPYLEGQQELVSRMIEEGHTIGNHTINHPNLTKCDRETFESELTGLNEKCENIYGVSMKYMRPPEGEYSERVLYQAKELGYKTIFWSFAYKDWDVNQQKGEQYAYDSVTPYFHNGEIILLHAVSSDNAAALGRIIDSAREQGFEFGTLDEIAQ